jgi:tripartite-type tricarboxylate transporter receptor subunit TctC
MHRLAVGHALTPCAGAVRFGQRDQFSKGYAPMKFVESMFALVMVAAALGAGSVRGADDFPTKPIRIIVPAAAGGGLDASSRLIGQKMAEKLGQQVIIDNRPGADTMLGTRLAKDVPADGYTILGQANGFTLLPYVRKDPGFDPMKDFTGLGMLLVAPMVLEVPPNSVDRTLQDLVARARTNSLSYGTGGVATPQQVASAMFLQAAGLKGQTEIPYKGAGPTLIDVIGGRLDFTFDGYNSSRSYIETGKTRALAVTGTTRMQPLPDVPTFQEAGFNFTYRVWHVLVVPAGTPKAAIQRLSEALKYSLEQKDIVERWRADGSDPAFLTPEETTEFLRTDYVNNAKLAVDLKYEKQ